MDGLFDLDHGAGIGHQPRPSEGLPAPAERGRLRRESGLSLYQVADACGVSETTARAWELGSATPRGNNAAAYGRLLTALQARLSGTSGPQPPATDTLDWAALGAVRHELPTLAQDEAPCRRCRQPTAQRVGGSPQHLGTRCPPVVEHCVAGAASAAPPQAPTPPLPPQRRTAAALLALPPPGQRATGNGPLAVVEASAQGLIAHLTDGRTIPVRPADDLPALLAWALSNALGAAPLRPEALPAGPLLVLTPSALAHLSLPNGVPEPAQLHPRSDHPMQAQIRAVGWQTDLHGLGPWMRLHPSTGDPACDSIHLAVPSWGALHADAWSLPGHLDHGQIAALLGQYASLLRAPMGPPGACGLQLMSDLRPPAHRHAVTGATVTPGVRGALSSLVDPAPCEAPPGHQRAQDRTERDALADRDITWWRPPTADESCRPYVVCLAVNLRHLAGSGEVRVADGPAQYVPHPAFNPKLPGSWYADLSAVPHHPLLPPAFASNGAAWHTTPALAYAAMLGARPQPVEGWLRPAPAAGPYLAPWYDHIRRARLSVLARLGITDDLAIPELLDALKTLPHDDGPEPILLRALHATAEDAFTALAQPPTPPDQAALTAWPSPPEPTWRPDLRAAVIAHARANLHRKLRRTARAGHFPLAVAGGHVLYAAHTPHLTEITDTPDIGFRIGVAAGHVRPTQVQSMDWYQDCCARGVNAAQLLNTTSPAW